MPPIPVEQLNSVVENFEQVQNVGGCLVQLQSAGHVLRTE